MNKRIVILGAGYGGLMTAIKLEKKTKNRDDTEIILVDRNDYHQYVHLAYEIVTDVKKISDLTIPISELIANRKIQFIQANITEINTGNKTVKTDKSSLQYDELVIALGSEPNFYGIKGAQENSLSFNSVESAAKIRDLLKNLFQKNRTPNIVIGGGGFTGVELAGEIADEYKFSQKVSEVLLEMGAKMVLGKLIVEVTPSEIKLKDGNSVRSSVFIWTAGVQGSSLLRKSGIKTGKGNRAVINEFCEAVDFSKVYVVGDCALVVDPENGKILPQCIEVALEQAEAVAVNIVADLDGSPKKAYRPKFSGLILAVGEKYGIGEIFGGTIEGKVAQMIKRLVHLQYVYEIAGLKEVVEENL
jgi:NADH dehydrogenase